MNYQSLKAELDNDPQHLGYAALLAAGDHVGVAALLNNPAGAGSAPLAVRRMAKNAFLLAVAPGAILASQKTLPIQARWSMVLQLVAATGGFVQLDAPQVQSLLTIAVADGVLSQNQVDAITRRPGSRAEVVLGADTVVRHQDVAIALRTV
jgi:hypothetical protein